LTTPKQTLRRLGRVSPDASIATTVHDVQEVDDVPIEPFDVPVDIIVTPTRVIRTGSRLAKPTGIIWELLDSGDWRRCPY